MKRYILKSKSLVDDILYITLKPLHGMPLRFRPGQYATIGFRGRNGHRSPMRCFSITSAANSTELQFATRIGGSFTQALAELEIDSEIFVQGPFGEFVQDTSDKKLVLIAGGIGITPYMSIIRSATQKGASIPMTLLYSCRVGRDVPFYSELRTIEQQSPWLKVILFATNQASPPATPRTLSGRMTEQHISEVVHGEYAGSTYFICGPKQFISDTIVMLRNNGISEDRIISESFTQASNIVIGKYNLKKLTYSFATAVLIAGILSIAALDLSRYVPSHTVSAQQPSSIQHTDSSASNSTNTSQTNDSSNNNSPSNSTNGNSSTYTTTPTYQNNYQQPVTSVS